MNNKYPNGSHAGGSNGNSNGNNGRLPGSSIHPSLSSTRSAPKISTPREFKPVEYHPGDAQRIQQMLEKVLGPEYVSSRSGGAAGSVSYIEGWKALNLANEIFGFNGWNSELISSTVDYFDTHGSTGRYSLGLSVVVRVTIKDGTYHEDIGYGFIDNAKSKAMAFEKCKKEAFTDGIKRCLRCFGNVLGNCLYDKTITTTIQKFKGPKREYVPEDFYRDPTVLAQEKVRQLLTKVNLLENSYNPSTVPNSAVQNNLPAIQKNGTGNPNSNGIAKVNLNYNSNLGSNNILASANDALPVSGPSFVGSTESTSTASIDKPAAYQPTAAEIEELDESFYSDEDLEEVDTADILAPPPQEIPSSQMMFVSARGADLLQKNPGDDLSKLPQFDPKFIAPNIKRTLDPTISAPTRNPNASQSASQTPKPKSYAPELVKRVGMPPSQRTSKRLHKDTTTDK